MGGDRLRIAINAQLPPDTGAGGVSSILVGLIKALGQLNDGDEEYVIVGPHRDTDWLAPILGPNQRLVRWGDHPGETLGRQVRRSSRTLFKKIARRARRSLGLGGPPHPPLVSDGFIEGLGCDVIHFPYQHFIICALPAIYNPHDLQHLHFPQFFTPHEIALRESIFPVGCHLAKIVAVASTWIKNDITRQYRIDPEKIEVIPWAPPTATVESPSPQELASVHTHYGLPKTFVFYPAMPWPHKNHIRLLEAAALLRDKSGLKIHLVFTGRGRFAWQEASTRLRELNLEGQVTWLDIVPHIHLRALYRLAQFAIVPTLFEAASAPVMEAWLEGTAVTCSKVTSLPEQVGEGGMLFDPFNVAEISEVIMQLATNETKRNELRQHGARRLADLSWEHTARKYRDAYRRVAA